MSTNIPEGLMDWAHSLSLEEYLSKQDLESGRTIHMAMRNIVENYNIQLQSSNTAVSRVTNWNNLIAQLKNIGIRVGQDEKTKIINGNHDIVFQILARLRDYHQKNQKQTEVDISKISNKNEISQSSSLLELFILAIMRNFNLNAKQSVALLSNDSKYLAHILAKGLKSDFRPVEGLISDFYKHMAQIISFCKNKQNQTFFLRAIKPSVISKSQKIAERGLILLQGFLMEISHRFQLLRQHLIGTLVLGIRRHPYLISEFSKFMLKTSDYNKDLFICLKSEASETDLQNIFLAMWNISRQQGRINDFFQMKGINQIISKSIANVRSSETIISSLNLLISLVSQNPDILANPDQAIALIDNIQEVTLSKVSSNIILIQQLFTLLSIFGKDKNPLAPSLYKIIINKFQKTINETHTKLFVQNFRQIIQDFPTIPFQPIIDSINTRIQENTISLSEIQIEFFFSLLRNQNLDSKGGLMIYNVVSKFLIQQPAFTSICADLVMSLLKKFNTQPIFNDMTVKLTKVCLAIHFANVKKLSQKRRSVTGTTKIDAEDASQKMKNVVLQQFLYRVIEEGVKDINRNVEPLISYSLIQVENLGREFGIGLRKILGLLGDPNEIVKKYEAEAKRLEQDNHKKQMGNRSKLKQSSWGGSPQNNRYGANDSRIGGHTNSEEGINRPKLLSKLDNSGMHQSFLGVTPAAQRGLQKYQKVYLSRIEKLNKQQLKKKQDEERQAHLKKIFQRKMLDNGISVKALKEDEYQYIYQFGVKEKEMTKDENKATINLLYYDPESEEDRDNKGLQYTMKKYQKILKLYYGEYSGFHKPKTLDLFDKIAQKCNYLYTKSLWKMLRDHTLDEFITVKECQYLVNRVNYKLDKKFDDMSCLDFEGFEQFIIQASYAMFTRPPKNLSGHPISEMVDELISRFKLYAGENRINQKVFDDPDSQYFNETEALRELNRKLDENPDYILPEGYKKITQKKVIFTHRIFLDAMSQNYKDVYEIVNDLVCKSLGVNIIEPFTTYETVAKARPTLYQKYEGGDYQTAKMSVFLKKQVAKTPIKNRDIAKQAGQVLQQIIEAVEFGHDQIGLKHKNKAQRDKKMTNQQQNKRRAEQEKKRAQRNKRIKSAIQKHQETQKQKQKQQKQKKAQEKRKKQEERQKQKKQEERLKKRVEEYQQKKKQDEKRRKMESKQRKKREKQEEERKKKQSEEIRRKIEEAKQKKKQEEAERKRIENQEAKQKRIQQKRKFQEEQKRKKEMVQQYKLGKSQLGESKVLDTKNG